MNKTEKALSLFFNNFNCSQAVFTAFAGDFGIDEKTALMLGTSFGGGAYDSNDRNGEIDYQACGTR